MNRRQGILYHKNTFMENEKLSVNLTLSKYVVFFNSKALKNVKYCWRWCSKILFLIAIMLTQTLCHTFCKSYYGETNNFAPSTLSKLKVSERKYVFTSCLATQLTWVEKENITIMWKLFLPSIHLDSFKILRKGKRATDSYTNLQLVMDAFQGEVEEIKKYVLGFW